MAETRNNHGVDATDAQVAVPGSAAAALAKHEAAKMSRRAVLAKIGFKAGAAALLALSVDDLARKVTQTIAANNRDNATAQAVAQEFKNAGIAFADLNSSGDTPCDKPTSESSCGKSCETDSDCKDCCKEACKGKGPLCPRDCAKKQKMRR